MTGRCHSTLAPLAADGFSRGALKLLTDGKRLPIQLDLSYDRALQAAADSADRLSISGVQEKLSLVLQQGQLTIAEIDGAYILKPVPLLRLPQFQDEVLANEHLSMQIARQVYGISVAPSALLRLGDGFAYLTRRFDRDSSGAKRSMEDFCSLAARSPDTHGPGFKYDGSYEEIGQLLQRFCPAYRIEVEKLYTRVRKSPFNATFSPLINLAQRGQWGPLVRKSRLPSTPRQSKKIE